MLQLTLAEPTECVTQPSEGQPVTILVTAYLTNGTKIGHLQKKEMRWHAHAQHDYAQVDIGKIMGTEVRAVCLGAADP